MWKGWGKYFYRVAAAARTLFVCRGGICRHTKASSKLEEKTDFRDFPTNSDVSRASLRELGSSWNLFFLFVFLGEASTDDDGVVSVLRNRVLGILRNRYFVTSVSKKQDNYLKLPDLFRLNKDLCDTSYKGINTNSFSSSKKCILIRTGQSNLTDSRYLDQARVTELIQPIP